MVLNTHRGDKYSKKYLKYKTKYLLLKKQKQMLGGVPFKGKFVVFFKHDESNDIFVKTLVEGSMTELSMIKQSLLGAYALTSNRTKIKLLNKSGIFQNLLKYIAAKIFKKDKMKLLIKQKIIETLKANNKPVDEKDIDKKLANMNITDEIDKNMKKELSPIKNGINLDNSLEYTKLDDLIETNQELKEKGINSYIVIDKGGNILKDYKIITAYNSVPYKISMDTNEFQSDILADPEINKQIDLFGKENEVTQLEADATNELLGGFINICNKIDKDGNTQKTPGRFVCFFVEVFNIILFIIMLPFLLAFGILYIIFGPPPKPKRRIRY